MLINKDHTFMENGKTATQVLFLYFNLCLTIEFNSLCCSFTYTLYFLTNSIQGRSSPDRMVVGSTYTISTKGVDSNPAHCDVYSIQHYVMKFVNNLLQVDGFLRVVRFPPPIKLIATI